MKTRGLSKFALVLLTLMYSTVMKSSALSEASMFQFDLGNKDVLLLELPSDSVFPKVQTAYYDDYSNMLSLFLYAKQKYNNFGVLNDSLNKTIIYSPNTQLNVGFGFNYQWLGIGIAFNLSFINNDDEKYGKTSRLDWQTNIYGNKAVYDFYLQSYKGFYLKNPTEVFPSWGKNQANYIRPDIETIALGLKGLYVFNNKRFSYKAAFMQTAVQKKSSGSFLLGASYFVQYITADSSFFPSNSYFGDLPDVVSHSSLYFGVNTGYAYNFIFLRNYFVSLSFLASIEAAKISSVFVDKTETVRWAPVVHVQPRIALGYNKPKWYAGLSFVRDSFFEADELEHDDYDLFFRSGNFRVFAGMRFDWLSKIKHKK